jgi:acyl dehydratase
MNTPIREISDVPREEIESNLADLMGPWGDADTYPVEYTGVRRMAMAVGAVDPIHFDKEAAIARGYRGIVAPWAFLWAIVHNLMEGEMSFRYGKATLHGDDSYEFHEPMVVGDIITLRTTNIRGDIKQGRSGRLTVVVTERRFTNQSAQLCAVLLTTTVRK